MFKKYLIPLAVLAILVQGDRVYAEQKNDLESHLKNLITNLRLDPNSLGISVKKVASEKELVAINSEKLLNPASNIKLLTSYCALKDLGPDYRWETSIFTNANVAGGIVHGDIFIKGNGDPYMVSERLWLFTRKLLNLGIKRIAGDVILDSKAFEKGKKDSAFKTDYDRSFTAIPCALSLNFNSVTIIVHPHTVGKQPFVMVDPDLDYFVVENDATTIADPANAKPKISIKPLKGKTRIKVYGKWLRSRKQKHYRKIFHPELYYGSAFLRFFADQGGKVEGRIRQGTTPKDAKRIATLDSRPLSMNIWGLNKFSNNFMATQILFTLGMKLHGEPATSKKGIDALNKCFDEMALRKKANVIESASGLSRKTRISASQIASILVKAAGDFKVAPEFINSLGIFGEDGTVKTRDISPESKGNVRVKTGGLAGVDALSGYVMSKKFGLLAFSCIANGVPESKHDNYRTLQDKLIALLANGL